MEQHIPSVGHARWHIRLCVGSALSAALLAVVPAAMAGEAYALMYDGVRAGSSASQYACTNRFYCNQAEPGVLYSDSRSAADAGQYAETSVTSEASLGVLKGSAHAYATGGLTNGQYTGGSALATPEWFDIFRIVSSTLPIGTPVQFEFGIELDSTLSGSGLPSGLCSAPTANGPYAYAVLGDGVLGPSIAHNLCGGSTRMVETTVETFLVGSQHSMTGQLSVFSTAYPSSPGSSGTFAATVSEDANASATFFIRSLTPGASYLEAIPEPIPASLMLLGLAVLPLVRRRAGQSNWPTPESATAL